MAYDCRAYQVLIASPSDVEEEREIAVRVIQEWNNLYSQSRNVVLLPLRWETHTAPEYGTRPQEVINRAIVDQCDLLLGIFWTRIGTPTDLADSGTLEEIERVSNAGKPVMLYFSKVGIDPGAIDLEQVASLKAFRTGISPNALMEDYKSQVEFRDKFSRQLEIKVRDLQTFDASDQPPPLSLNLYSIEKEEFVGDTVSCSAENLEITNLKDHLSLADSEGVRKSIEEVANQLVQVRLSIPIIFSIKNTSASGIRNLYIELSAHSTPAEVEISERPPSRRGTSYSMSKILAYMERDQYPEPENELRKKIAQLREDGLTRKDGGWSFTFAWDALQPERIRVVKPFLYLRSNENAAVEFKAKVYADSFPQPLLLSASMSIKIKLKKISLEQAIPDLESVINAAKIRDDTSATWTVA